jgi:hypothetical protein
MSEEHPNDVDVPSIANAPKAHLVRDAWALGTVPWHAHELLCFVWAKVLGFIVLLVVDEQRFASVGMW